MQHVNHVLHYVPVDVIGFQAIGVGGGAKGKGVTLVEPGVGHDLGHLDSFLWIGGEKLTKEILTA